MLAHTDGTDTAHRSPPLAAGSRDPATACSCNLDTETGPAGPIQVLRVSGEIDTLTRPLVQTALDAVLAQTPQDLVIDLAGVRFCSVRGFALLAAAAHTARAAGIGFVLSGLTGHLDRIATLLWPEEHFIRYRSVAAAVTALRMEHTYRLS